MQKRFTGERTEPVGWERYTERARRLVQDHVPAAAASLGHGWIGTEHLLLGFYVEPEALAPRILLEFGLDRDRAIAGIGARIDNVFSGRGPLTPRAWVAPRPRHGKRSCSGTTTSAPNTSCSRR